MLGPPGKSGGDPALRALRILVSATAAKRVANNLPTDLFSDVEAINGSFGLSVAYPDASGTFIIHLWPALPPCVQISDAEAAALRPRLHVRLTYWSSLQEPSGSDLPADYTELSWVLAAYRALAIDRLG